jgi:membrane-associated phospholipid phosphatase
MILPRRSTLLQLGSVLLIMLLAAWLFASLAEDVVQRETLARLDPVFGNWLLARTTANGDKAFSIITLLGNAIVISLGTGGLGLWLAKRKDWGRLGLLFATVVGAAVLNLALKYLFLRPRPDLVQAYAHDTGYSFPSGHAMISMAFYGTIAYLLFVALRNWRLRALVCLGLAIVLVLIGFSRLYLGVHYLTDILGGWAAGGLWLATCILGGQLEVFSRWPNRK